MADLNFKEYQFVIEKIIRTGGAEGEPHRVTEANILISITDLQLWAETHQFTRAGYKITVDDIQKFEGKKAKGKIEFQFDRNLRKSNQKNKSITSIEDTTWYKFNGEIKKVDTMTDRCLIDFGEIELFLRPPNGFKTGDYIGLEGQLVIREFEWLPGQTFEKIEAQLKIQPQEYSFVIEKIEQVGFEKTNWNTILEASILANLNETRIWADTDTFVSQFPRLTVEKAKKLEGKKARGKIELLFEYFLRKIQNSEKK